MIDGSISKRLKIVHIITETAHAKTFVLEPMDGWKPVYKPGQFITLVFKTRYGEKRRSYSMSSSSFPGEALSITVKHVENGEFSRFMLQNLQQGDILHSIGIAGLFTLPEKIEVVAHFCFIAAGSGIVPCYSLIKTLLQRHQNKITLIYSNKTQEDTIYYYHLLDLQNKYPGRFSIRFLYSSSNDLYNKRLSKWLLEQLLAEYIGKHFQNVMFYLCGPFEYMQAQEITLRMYVPKENIIKENFSSLPRLSIPKPPDTEAHRVKIHINGHVHDLTVQYPKSILATAKLQNIELPYSCEAGRCSSCVATCTKGKIWIAYNEVLVEKEIEKGRVLVCQGYPVGGDAELVYDIN